VGSTWLLGVRAPWELRGNFMASSGSALSPHGSPLSPSPRMHLHFIDESIDYVCVQGRRSDSGSYLAETCGRASPAVSSGLSRCGSGGGDNL
jgi:hypothetical protein